MIRKLKQKSFWKNGAGEIIGFLCILPFIIFMIALFVSIVQIGTIREQMDYLVYKECRQEVIASWDGEGKESAFIKNAKNTIKSDAKEYFADTKGVNTQKITVDVELLDSGDDGTTKTSTRNNTVDWLKGSYCRCTLSVYVNAPLEFMSGMKSSSIVMMIERPANEGGDYPWFRDMD